MPRERWFYAKDMRRMGPFPKRHLVESLLGLPDPRGCLIWRHGLPAWTSAREVPEIDRQLAPFAKPEPAPAHEPVPAPPPSHEAAAAERAAEYPIRAPARTGAPTARRSERPGPPNIALYFGGLAAVFVVVVAGWRLPQREVRRPPREHRGLAPAFAGWADQEADLPPAELRRLRGVAAWSGNRLTVTLYNGSAWRITEILVRTSRLRGDQFVDGETPERPLPLAGPPVDAGTADCSRRWPPTARSPGSIPWIPGLSRPPSARSPRRTGGGSKEPWATRPGVRPSNGTKTDS